MLYLMDISLSYYAQPLQQLLPDQDFWMTASGRVAKKAGSVLIKTHFYQSVNRDWVLMIITKYILKHTLYGLMYVILYIWLKMDTFIYPTIPIGH